MMKRYVGVVLFVIGTNVCTYTFTRYQITTTVLTMAAEDARRFLEAYGFAYSLGDPDVEISEERELAGRQLVTRIHLAGGMYHWWNDSLPVWGLGILMTATGALVPFVGRRMNTQA